MEQIVFLSAVTAIIAFNISETSLFAPAREWLRNRSLLVGKLVACGFCLGQWIALTLVAVYQTRLFFAWWPLDLVLTAFVVAWLAAFQWAALCWLMTKTGK
jgi:hypothetical protein